MAIIGNALNNLLPAVQNLTGLTTAPGSAVVRQPQKGAAGGMVTVPKSAATSVPAATGARAMGLDDLGQVDYSVKWDNAVSGGASLSQLEQIYKDREQKKQGAGYEAYQQNDPKGQAMKAELERMEREQADQEREDYIREMTRRQQEAALAAIRAAYEKNVSGIDRAQGSIAPEYQSARNQAAAQAELQKKNFAEFAAANGLNSGAGGQAQLSFANALQSNLSGIAQKEASSMADLELQRSQMETDYNNAIAQAKANGNYQMAQQLYEDKVRQDELMLAQMQWKAQQDLTQQQFQFNKDQAAIGQGQWQQEFDKGNEQYDQKWAYSLAQESGNFDILKAFGLSDETIAALKKQWELKTYGGAPAGGGGYQTVKSGTVSTRKPKAVEDEQPTDGNNANAVIPQSVLAELSRLEDTRNPTTQIYNAIRRHSTNGTINDAQAQALLRRYGLG